MALLTGAGPGFAAAAGLASAPAGSLLLPAPTSPPPARLLLAPPAALPADGRYATNDIAAFMLDRREGQVRLRFVGSDEVFYLSSEPASLGGRVLKYDTGDVAMTVAGWGGVTLYTGEVPSGIPAERQASASDLEPKPVAAKDVKPFAAKLSRDLASHGAFSIGFDADWDTLAQADETRALAIDSMRNATYALEQMATETEHNAIAGTLHMVKVTQAPQSGIAIQAGTLVISYAPQSGPSARPSSLAIARALEAGF